MHVPDGFIPLWQAAIYYLIAIIVGFYSVRWARSSLDERKIPLLAVLAAGIFAIQAMNIPIPWGTSGHMVGAALVAIVIGSPFAGFLVLTTVLIIQALFFGDGGLTALGINIFNMAIISSWIGFYGYKWLKPIISEVPAVFIAAWASLFLSAVAMAIQLFFAGIFPLSLGIYFMGLYHFVIGIFGEGLITTIAFLAIKGARPDLMSNEGVSSHG